MLLFIVVSMTIIFLFFACEIITVKNNIDMPNVLRYVFGVLLLLLSLSIALYLIGSKTLKYNVPDFILTNIVELVLLVIVIFVASIVLLIKK